MFFNTYCTKGPRCTEKHIACTNASLKCLPFGILSFKYFAYLVYFEWLHYRTAGKFSRETGKKNVLESISDSELSECPILTYSMKEKKSLHVDTDMYSTICIYKIDRKFIVA